MVTRRGFLGMMAGALAAPAIVKAENLMKIVVPPKRKLILVTRYPITGIESLKLMGADIDGDVAEVYPDHMVAYNVSEDGFILPPHMAERFKHETYEVRRAIFDHEEMHAKIQRSMRLNPRDMFLSRPAGLQAMPTEKATSELARWMARTGRV